MQALLQRRVDQRLVVDGVENLVDGTLGDRLVDAGALNLHLHAEFAPATDARLSARNGGCNSRIVDGALLAQSRNRSVDGIRLVASAREPLANLLFRQLASAEHLQTVDICRRRHVCLRGYDPKRVTSEALEGVVEP